MIKRNFSRVMALMMIMAMLTTWAAALGDNETPFVPFEPGTGSDAPIDPTPDIPVVPDTEDKDTDREEEQPEAQKPEKEPEAAEPVSAFDDVQKSDYFFNAVLWAVENGITNGVGVRTFAPNAICTRAQVVTFLWRAAGEPEPERMVCPFTDVAADAYYYKAVLWAVENGITNGTSADAFSPNATVTRAQTAAFLYRHEQSKGGGFTGAWMFRVPFTDVPEWAFESIAWCYMHNITNGTSESTFSPDNGCTRGQIVTFLYRTFAK